ncbi:MAG: branched-chain amino acid ABC transporter permease [Deltaproteobacteria bacterium]|nr:branched-chain amino acid ABC transporter permease [Deltaproteobacteria bacterium]
MRVRSLAGAVAALGALVLIDQIAPRLLNPYFVTILSRIGIAVIAAVSLQLVNGFTGQFSIGHAGFMAIGAYASAALSVFAGAEGLELAATFVPISVARVAYFPLALVFGGLAAAVVGIFVAVPALRLRGDYLAIATLGAGEIIRIAILNIDAVGGARGFSLASSAHPAVDLRFEGLGGVFAVAALTVLAIARLVYSGGGLAFRAVREDETAAESIGIATTRVKVEAFLVASFFAGVAGALFAHSEGYIHTNSFGFVRSFELVVFVVLGGLGSISGAILAAATLTAAPELLRGLGDWRMVLYSLLLIAMMLSRPQGLLGQRELWPISLLTRGSR